MDKVIYDEEARPVPSPKGMTAQQRAVRDITHIPYDPPCQKMCCQLTAQYLTQINAIIKQGPVANGGRLCVP